MMPKKKAHKRTKPLKPVATREPKPKTKAEVAGAAQIHQNIFASDWCQENKAPN